MGVQVGESAGSSLWKVLETEDVLGSREWDFIDSRLGHYSIDVVAEETLNDRGSPTRMEWFEGKQSSVL
jgi:hypothetical protein